MEINYIGHSCIKIKAKPDFANGNGPVSIVTDPFSGKFTGLTQPKIETDIVTVSHQHEDHNFLGAISGEYFLIDQPGEYEVKGISVLGYPTDHDTQNGSERGKNIVFVIEAEDLRVCHLGDLGRQLTEKEIEEIGVIDVLIIPIGGQVTLGPKEAREVINKMTPSIVIPIHYRVDGLNKEVFGELATVDEFLKENSSFKSEVLPKLIISRDRINEDETKIVVLDSKT